jgi:hypothetical protein
MDIMAQYNQPRPDPEITYNDPIAYIYYLRSRGLNPMQVDQLVTQRFGPGKTQEQRQREAEKKAEQAGYAQTAGVVGGAVAASQIPGLFSAGTAAGTTAAGAGAATAGGAAAAGTGAAAAGGAAAGGTAAGGAAAGTGAAAGGAAGTTGGAAGGIGMGSIGSVALPVAAVALAASNAWETGMKDIVRGRGDRADWTNQGINMLTGALPNTALRLMGKRSIGAMMKSGKSLPQQLRDDFRGKLRETGVAEKIDGSDHVTLADGSKFNIGLDGKTKYQNVGENIDGKKTRNAWDVDFSNPLAKFATDQLDPMIRNIYGADDPKKKFFPGQYTGMLVNAVTSNAKTNDDVLKNIQAVIGKSTFAQEAGAGVQGPTMPVQRPPRGEVVRVSPGMYMNDKGHVGPAKTVRQALEANYKKGK